MIFPVGCICCVWVDVTITGLNNKRLRIIRHSEKLPIEIRILMVDLYRTNRK